MEEEEEEEAMFWVHLRVRDLCYCIWPNLGLLWGQKYDKSRLLRVGISSGALSRSKARIFSTRAGKARFAGRCFPSKVCWQPNTTPKMPNCGKGRGINIDIFFVFFSFFNSSKKKRKKKEKKDLFLTHRTLELTKIHWPTSARRRDSKKWCVSPIPRRNQWILGGLCKLSYSLTRKERKK